MLPNDNDPEYYVGGEAFIKPKPRVVYDEMSHKFYKIVDTVVFSHESRHTIGPSARYIEIPVPDLHEFETMWIGGVDLAFMMGGNLVMPPAGTKLFVYRDQKSPVVDESIVSLHPSIVSVVFVKKMYVSYDYQQSSSPIVMKLAFHSGYPFNGTIVAVVRGRKYVPAKTI